MKRLALLILVISFLLCGCNTRKNVSPVTKGIKFTLNIYCGETNYDVSALIDNGNCMNATVSFPEAIKGMKITSNKFETLAEYKNLKYTYNEDAFSGESYVVTVYNILRALGDKQLTLKNGENCVLDGKYLGEEYSFTFSPSGLPIELNIESKNFKAVFNDIGII